MIHYSGILTVKCLRKICRIYKIKIDNYINKHIILNILNKENQRKTIKL